MKRWQCSKIVPAFALNNPYVRISGGISGTQKYQPRLHQPSRAAASTSASSCGCAVPAATPLHRPRADFASLMVAHEARFLIVPASVAYTLSADKCSLHASRYHAELTMTNSGNGSQDGQRRTDWSGTQAGEITRRRAARGRVVQGA